MTCKDCNLHEHAKNPCIKPIGLLHTDVMIISDYPSWAEDNFNGIWASPTGKFIFRELFNVGIDASKCYVTKAVKCYSPKKPSVKQIKACLPKLQEEIRTIKPRYILTFGDISMKAVLNKTGITKHRGKLFEINEGIKVIPSLHPSLVIKQPHHLTVFRADLNYFSRLLDGEWSQPKDFDWTIIKTYKEAEEMLNDVLSSRHISYDIETTCLDDYDNGKIRAVGIATDKKCYILPYELDVPLSGFVHDAIKTIFEKKGLIKIAQNGAFDNHWLRTRGIKPHLDFDTMLASYVINVTLPHDLKYMAKTYCGAGDYAIDARNIDKVIEEHGFETVARYCALDVYYTLKLYHILKAELLKDQKLARVFKYIIMPGARVLENIRSRGAYINLEKLKQVKAEYTEKVKELEKELFFMVGKKEVNWNSPDQLADVLFNQLKLPVLETTATGKPSTGKSTLLRLVDKHPIPQKVLELRKYSKALNAFLIPWEEKLEYEIKKGRQPRLHTQYHIAQTATGRLSASNPNLQQVPRDKNVRSLVSAPPGRKLIEADFSQIELRIAAFIAGAESMKKIYRMGGDIHTETASEVSGVRPEDVTKPQRTAAKAVNFGFLYGMWWKSFKAYAFDSYGVIVTDEEAQHARERYFEKYYELLEWHERQKREVRAFGYIRTPIGRIRHLPNINSPDKDLRSEAERQAINTPVQSMASDLMLLAMIQIDQLLDADKAMIVGQIHDAILVEVDEDYVVEASKIIKETMEGVPKVVKKLFGITIDLPIVADVEVGDGWGIGEEIKI